MHGRFIQRFSYGNVMSTVALFVALGGVSYAGTSLPANSVGKSASSFGNSASHFSAASSSPLSFRHFSHRTSPLKPSEILRKTG